jgi:hypothetical protein
MLSWHHLLLALRCRAAARSCAAAAGTPLCCGHLQVRKRQAQSRTAWRLYVRIEHRWQCPTHAWLLSRNYTGQVLASTVPTSGTVLLDECISYCQEVASKAVFLTCTGLQQLLPDAEYCCCWLRP